MSTLETQRQLVERLLIERGSSGISAYELIYQHGVTRLSARIYDLRQAGWHIGSKTKKGETARYWLEAPPPGLASTVVQETMFNLEGTR